MNAKSTKTKKAAQKTRADETPEKFIAAYKGFDKDFACRGFRYEVGKTYTMDGEADVCNRGFHACENPFDVLDHYAAFNDDGTPNRFAEVEVGGKVDEEKDCVGNVRKVAGAKIRVKAEISFAGLVKAGIARIIEKTRQENVEKQTPTNGDWAQIGSSGYGAQIGSSGDWAKIGSSGDWAQIESTGENCVVMASGRNSAAAAAKGSWITLAEWRADNEKKGWAPVCVKTAFVDGEKIRAGVLYRLRNGEFEEVAR